MAPAPFVVLALLGADASKFSTCSGTPFCAEGRLGRVQPAASASELRVEDGAAYVSLSSGHTLRVDALAHGAWRVQVFGADDADAFVCAPFVLEQTSEPSGIHAEQSGARVLLRAAGDTQAESALAIDGWAEGEPVRVSVLPTGEAGGAPELLPAALELNVHSLLRVEPTRAAVDLSFADAHTVYGLPERALPLALEPTRAGRHEPIPGRGPYRLYNSDRFDYDASSPAALYGSIPLLHALRADGRVSSALWLGASDLYVDLWRTDGGNASAARAGMSSHFFSDDGRIDLVLALAPSLRAAVQRHTLRTGRPPMPPLWAVGFHLSHWGVRGAADALALDANADRHGVPLDALWLDIDHTDGKRYFTWDPSLWPAGAAARVQRALAAKGRRAVAIADPHLKADPSYELYARALAEALLVNVSGGGAGARPFVGECWPGKSAWLDFVSPAARRFWSDAVYGDAHAERAEHTLALHAWNDMNEPSVFDQPDVTLPKSARHAHALPDGRVAAVPHRVVHNAYGMLMARATWEGAAARRAAADGSRPFLLSRAFFAGSQRYGAVWTGDNSASWDHLARSTPMLLALSLSGLGFVGADVGGFGGGDPSSELLVRWYQAGAYYPFFRAHAHADSRRREPWVHDAPTLRAIRAAIRGRHELLPHLYALFHQAAHAPCAERRAAARGGRSAAAHGRADGPSDEEAGAGCALPLMRPLSMHYPDDPRAPTLDDQFLLGRDLLVKPVCVAGQRSLSFALPALRPRGGGGSGGGGGGGDGGDGAAAEPWYDSTTLSPIRAHRVGRSADGRPLLEARVHAPLDRLPVLQRGGSVVPRRWRRRRSALAAAGDPITLVVALDGAGRARGRLYVDDGDGEVCGAAGEVEAVWHAQPTERGGAPGLRVRYEQRAGCECAQRAHARAHVVERIVVAHHAGFSPCPARAVVRGGLEAGEAREMALSRHGGPAGACPTVLIEGLQLPLAQPGSREARSSDASESADAAPSASPARAPSCAETASWSVEALLPSERAVAGASVNVINDDARNATAAEEAASADDEASEY